MTTDLKRVVRYSGAMETQVIQNDRHGKTLFSVEDTVVLLLAGNGNEESRRLRCRPRSGNRGCCGYIRGIAVRVSRVSLPEVQTRGVLSVQNLYRRQLSNSRQRQRE